MDIRKTGKKLVWKIEVNELIFVYCTFIINCRPLYFNTETKPACVSEIYTPLKKRSIRESTFPHVLVNLVITGRHEYSPFCDRTCTKPDINIYN